MCVHSMESIVRVLYPNIWLDAAVKLLHAYAEACEQKRPFSDITTHARMGRKGNHRDHG